MKRLFGLLLAIETLLLAGSLAGWFPTNAAVLLIAVNSVVLIWSARRLRRKPSCCR